MEGIEKDSIFIQLKEKSLWYTKSNFNENKKLNLLSIIILSFFSIIELVWFSLFWGKFIFLILHAILYTPSIILASIFEYLLFKRPRENRKVVYFITKENLIIYSNMWRNTLIKKAISYDSIIAGRRVILDRDLFTFNENLGYFNLSLIKRVQIREKKKNSDIYFDYKGLKKWEFKLRGVKKLLELRKIITREFNFTKDNSNQKWETYILVDYSMGYI